MKNIRSKACAAMLAVLMLASSCSVLESTKDDIKVRRAERDKKSKVEETEEEEEETTAAEENTEETTAETTEETTEETTAPAATPEPDVKETEETENKTSASDLKFPEEPYDFDKVHPKHEPGKITGEDAKKELDQIELDYLAYVFEDDYVDAVICFEDPEALGISIDNVSWGEINADIDEECIKTEKDFLDRLYALDYESFDESDRVFYDKIVYDIEEGLYLGQYDGFSYLTPVFNSFTSQQCDIFFILDVINFKTKEDAENYITLLKDIDRYYDELCAFEEKRVELGYAGNDALYVGVAESFDNLVKQKDDCFLYESFEKRLEDIEGLSDADKKALTEEHEKVMKEIVFPEFEECSERMTALKGNCKNDKGLFGFEHGKDYYQAIVRKQSNSSITPQKAGEELDAQMSGFIASSIMLMPAQHDYTVGDVQENLDHLYGEIFDYFPEIPEHKYSMRNVPDVFKDSFSPAAYLGYHIDNFDSNLLIINSAADNSDFGTVVAHEAYPGHMYQSLYTRMVSDHYYMVIFDSSGYAEGWAQYVEVNSPKFFGASSKEVQYFIVETLLDVYLMARIDIGINYEGWSKKDAVDHFADLFGFSILTEDGLEKLFDICLADPGYPLPYGLGYYEITKTLDSINALAPDLEIKELHEIYLNAQTGTYEQILESAKRQIES